MADIEPYKQIQKTNIKEHNDLVAKVNEIVDVINNTNLDTITPKIAKLEQDVSEITANDSVQDSDIMSLKTKTAKLEQDVSGINDTDSSQSADIQSIKSKNSEQDNTLATHTNQIDVITKSLVSDVVLMNGTTTGNMKVRVERADAPSFDSNDYNIQKPTSVELVQGSAPAMVKAQITLSDGTVLVSDDFMFTTEAIGQDVYISSFVFKNGNVAGTISADIGLSNGSTITANNFAVPTDPNVTSAIADLQTRLTTVENSGATDISALRTTVSEHTNEINTLNSDVAGLTTDKADVNNNEQTITAGTINATNINKNGVDVATVNDISGKADLINTNQDIIAKSISASTIDALNIRKNNKAVATVNDIPDISGKADLSNPSQYIVTGSISATNMINAPTIKKGNVAVATINDIPDISGKVDKAQGVSNAGKVLGIGSDGNVTPVAVSSGGGEWEEINVSSLPTDFKSGDILRIMLYELGTTATVENTSASWNNSTLIDNGGVKVDKGWSSQIIEIEIPSSGANAAIVVCGDEGFLRPSYAYRISCKVNNYNNWNSTNPMSIQCLTFSGNDAVLNTVDVSRANLSNYVKKMWRLKK